ncbi:MFS transporter [Bradyrhizobium ivorense]|uniref:MFS transporter n=1 Tax=Bradyrhizobium ivorense TaxID=2511166 RepID=UPI0010B2F00D|nr:MFS transporter [Bradyrhizobium ivorense]VIO78498.1 Proline/betaine transporter [Bradyrhizobium ivorense]
MQTEAVKADARQAEAMAEMRRRVVISSTIGNALEWFDFTVFGLFAGILSKLFFPADNPSSSLLLTFATFGIAFAARPLGGLVFGLYADKHGRKKALVVMITLMAIGTGLLGFLPTFGAIGIAAPLLLLLARLIQGFSAGGEFGSASAMLIEFASPGRRGFYGSFQMVSQSLAFGLGAAMAIGLNLGLSADAFASWGWRVPFILGILIGPTGWYLRQRCDESPEFQAYLAEKAATAQPKRQTTLGQLFSEHPRELIASFCLIAAGTAINYVNAIFLPAYAVAELKLPLLNAQLGLLVFSLANAAIAIAAGALSDRIGRRAVLMPAMIIYAVLFYLLLQRLVAEPTTTNLWQLQAAAVFLGALAGPGPAFMTEIFPVGVRSTGASLMYNLAVMLFGGLAPFINTWLVQATGDKAAPVYYIFLAAAIGLAGLSVYRARPQTDAAPAGLSPLPLATDKTAG